MFTIYGGKTEFEQWDLDQLVSNPCMKEGNEVVFKNSHGETYVTKAFKRGGEVLADVPNYLLQKHGNILVTLEQGADRHTECETIITVRAKDKPEDYKCSGNIKERKQDAVGGGGGGAAYLYAKPSDTSSSPTWTLYTDKDCTMKASARDVYDTFNGKAARVMYDYDLVNVFYDAPCTWIWTNEDYTQTDPTADMIVGVCFYTVPEEKIISIEVTPSKK